MNLRLPTVAAAALALATPVLAAEPAKVSKDLYTLFTDGCVANMANADGVRTWAVSRKLVSVSSKAALNALAGGQEGAVWEARMPSGAFAMALRTSGACAVYGDKLDAATVEGDFAAFVDGLKKSGHTVEVVQDDKGAGDHGQHHALVYIAKGQPSTMTVAMIANEKPGGLFQATLQISPPQATPAPVVHDSGPLITEAHAGPPVIKHRKKRVSAPGASR